jgi:hypothetical protein
MKKYSSLKEFYPYYYSEHQNSVCRVLHLMGTALSLTTIVWNVSSLAFHWLLLAPVVGYGFAWIGHFFFEKNRPATFKNPFYSFISDFIMFYRVLTGKEKIKTGE